MVRTSVFLGTAVFILGAASATLAYANGSNMDMKNWFTPKISADLHRNFDGSGHLADNLGMCRLPAESTVKIDHV